MTALNAPGSETRTQRSGFRARAGPEPPGPGTHRHAQRPDRRTDRASGERGPGLRGAAGPTRSPGGGRPALHPRRDRAGGVPGGEKGSPGAPSLRTRRAGPAPPPAVCGSVRRSRVCWSPGRPAPLSAGRPTFSVALCRALGAASASSIVGPQGRDSRARGRGPMALAPPAPASGAFPSAPHRSLAVPSAQSPPCAPIPARGARPRPLDPRGRPTRALPPPPRRALGSVSPDLCRPWVSPPRVAVSVSVALPVCSLPSPPLPGLSLACLCLSRSRSGPCLSLPPTLAAAPRLRTGPRRLRRHPRPAPPEAELPPPAARRELPSRAPAPLLRDFRPSSHVTRAPCGGRAPALPAPEPRAARGPGPAPFLRLTGHHTPVPTARRPGPEARAGARSLLPEILPGFSSSLQGRSSRRPIPTVRCRVFVPLTPLGSRWKVSLCSEGTVGGRGSVPGPVPAGSAPLRSPSAPEGRAVKDLTHPAPVDGGVALLERPSQSAR